MYDHVDLFSGLGCWALAARANGLQTIAFCEREEWLAAGLERTWGVPCHRDIKTFPAQDYAGRVWLLTGSPPCQPASCAGKRRGKADDRWLWEPTIGVCEVIQPAWFIFENPPGLDGVGLDGIISDLERLGYEVATLRIPACAVNSPQLRDRFWIVGCTLRKGPQPSGPAISKNPSIADPKPTQSGVVEHSNRIGEHDERQGKLLLSKRWDDAASRPTQSRPVADSPKPGREGNNSTILQGRHECIAQPPEGSTVADGDHEQSRRAEPSRQQDRSRAGIGGLAVRSLWQDFDWIPFNGAVYRIPVGLYSMADGVVHGIPKRFRAKLISALGNAIVWQVAAQIIKAIKASDHVHPTP